MSTIVQNKEKAYGYNYTSLASLAAAGIEIPKMRTATADGKEYVEYLDTDGVWQRGAQIVVPEMKGMNAAQAYGSALTYARRYTVMMSMSVACTDDQLLEAQEPEKPAPKRETRKAEEPAVPLKPPKDAFVCADCGQPIKNYGKTPVSEIVAGTMATYGKALCWECAKKAKQEKNNKEENVNA